RAVRRGLDLPVRGARVRGEAPRVPQGLALPVRRAALVDSEAPGARVNDRHADAARRVAEAVLQSPGAAERGLRGSVEGRAGALGGRRVPDVVRTLFYRPELFGRPFSAWLQQVMRGPSDWSVGERELFAAFVSRRNNCPF